MASISPISCLNPAELSNKGKEEGELSSSDDGENSVRSASRSTGIGNLPIPAGSSLGHPLNKFPQGIQAGKVISGTNPANSVDARAFVQPINDKNFDKNRMPFKSANPGWSATSVIKNNLVISFSDDDSDSEPEGHRQEKALERKLDTSRVNGNQRLASLSSAKSSKLQQTARNMNKVMPNKSALSCTSISSISKINGVANSKGISLPSAAQGSRVRNVKTVNRNLSSQEHGFDRGVGLNNTKLRDLRQQIALRERELKLKAAQQNKESTSVSGRDCNAMNIGGDATRKPNASPVNIGQLEPKEPDKKRLKVSGSFSTQLNSNGQQQATKSILQPKGQPLENGGLMGTIMLDHSQKGSPSRRLESSLVKWQEDKRMEFLSGNLPSGSINSNCGKLARSCMQVDPCVPFNQSAPLTNMTSDILPTNKSPELNHQIEISGRQPPGSYLKPSSERDFVNGCEYLEGMSGDKTLEPSLNNNCQASLNSMNFLSNLNASEHSNMDLQSLIEMEESLDKELENSQEHRRRCEIEERNALKAYRKAQRTLIEANARCAELYRKRELHSAHFRSFMMNDSSFLWSSRQHEQVGIRSNHENNLSRNLDLIPRSSHQMQPEYDDCNQLGFESNNQCVSGGPLHTSYRNVNGQILGSEPCSEPDGSSSEQLPHNCKNAANAISSLSNDPNISADEDEETFPLDHETEQPNIKNHNNDNTKQYSSRDVSINGSQDPLILEATLRSELFARLGMRTASKNSGSSNMEPADELGTENDNGSERTQMSNGSGPLSEAGKNKDDDLGGNDKPQKSVSEALVQRHNHERTSSNIHSAADSEDNGCSIGGHQLTTSVELARSVLRSAFGHMEILAPITPLGLLSRKNQQDNACDYYNQEGGSLNSEEIKCNNAIANSMEESVIDICGREVGSFNCNLVVDPFWPLCLYELRGRCNNDECPWQHVKDFSNGNVCQLQPDDSNSADCQVGLTLHQQKCNGMMKFSKQHRVLMTPTYLVGLDILKSDPHSYKSIVVRRSRQCWQKCFSICLALSSWLQKDLPADEPSLRGSDGRIEVHGSWNRPSSYFQSRNNMVNHLNQPLISNLHSLEMALLILTQEVNKLEGMKKALSVLSRTIEADPKSEILWIIYLLIYYSNIDSVGKDDMFSCAVKHNDGSYGLWLMYINSRSHIDDRLVAYDVALTALCRQVSASNRNKVHDSACILDLFLQMMDCLCISGNAEKAIQKIYGLFPVATNSDEPDHLLLSNVLTSLTISDRYVFWVCCVYLVIYRKLPDAVVQLFEFEKELLAIEWPSIHFLDEDKQKVVRLVEEVVDSFKFYGNDESLESETNSRSAQHFALNHVRCMVALNCLESCQNLLEEYIKLYPSGLELVLLSARIWTDSFEVSSFDKFEEALSKWPKDAPGIHCIWNQYIEWALHKGDADFGKELIFRWFNSFSKGWDSQHEIVGAIDRNSLHGSLESASASNPDALISNSNQMDIMFGYLNLSLIKLLQNDHIEAHLAVDRAYKAAALQYIKHCLREHAAFLLSYESQFRKDASIREQLNILNGYLDDARAFLVSEPLSRQFINNIEKPRVRQLIGNILSPVSSNFSLVNLVLEVWYGPSLLPKQLIAANPKELVDFIEAILEMDPSNYQLAFSLFKLLSRDYNSTNVSSDSILYWASSTLVNAIFHAVPIAPEYAWVEAAGFLGGITGIDSILDRFYKRALSVYPFSMKLWNCFYNLSKTRGEVSNVVAAAREKGIEIG